MRLSRRRFLAGAAVLAAAGSVPTWMISRRRGSLEDQRPEHVILVDWDGFDPAYLDRAPTPNLDALTELGSISAARSTYPTISNSARASMSTGAYPEVHGNLAYYLDRETGKALGENRSLAAETVMETLAEAGKTVASVQWYMVQDHGVAFGDPRHLYVEPGGLFGARVDAAINILEGSPVDSVGGTSKVPKVPDFLAVYGSDLDDLGHAEGPDGPNIGPLLSEMDRQLGRLVQATKDAGIDRRTAFIVTGDHGMTGWKKNLTPSLLDRISSAGYAPEVVTSGGSPKPSTEVVLITGSVRTVTIALRGQTTTDRGRRKITAAVEAAPHVAKVLGTAELADLSAGYGSDVLVAEAEEPWGFLSPGESAGAARGAHGSTREMPVPLLLSGAGIRQNSAPRDPRLVDVAPTVCALLGTRPPKDAQGRVLQEALGI
jgi:arylsulfatase A-like enzyme